MAIFSKFFEKSKRDPEIKFGRFSDSYKEEKKYDAWDIALELYENRQYLKSFKYFLVYLQDESSGNIKIDQKGDEEISFRIFQGSKEITGYANNKKLYAEAKIAKATELEIGLLRRMVEKNYGLEYSRYALDNDDCITMVFDTNALDASPYKLYYALKELATNADKQDDILVSEFKSLQRVNTGHIRQISEEEKMVKYDFFIKSIEKVIHILDHGSLNLVHYPGGASYLMLDLIYKLDFLIKPEGLTMEKIEQIHNIFFNNKTDSSQRKNELMRKGLRKMLKIKKSQFFDEIYEVLSTFGITLPSGHERLRSLIDSDLNNMDWYVENKHIDIALSIPGYIVGYSLFNFALPAPVKDLLMLYYKVFNGDFFKDLDFSFHLKNDGTPDRKIIIREVKHIRNKYKDRYPNLGLKTNLLNFDSTTSFAKSYLIMIRKMEISKKKIT